ncbi:MAG: hypothetical protein ACFFC3_09860, partial [Candidatus Odinarchaeota archaeon]
MLTLSLNFANEITQSGEYFEAGEFLFSVAEIFEDIEYSKALNMYLQIIEIYKKLIVDLKLQGKLHEIAELYLRIADIYHEKIKDLDFERINILNSINFLKQESQLLKEFNETRKLAQNYQNIAELFLKLSYFENAIKYSDKVIEISKIQNFYDMISFSYQQISSCYAELEDYDKSQEVLLEGIEY